MSGLNFEPVFYRMETLWVEVLMFFICVLNVSIVGHNITISDDCMTEYQLADDYGTPTYNVSISILKDCPLETFNLEKGRNRFKQFSLDVVKDGSERKLTLKWEHSICTKDYIVGVRATFDPSHLVHDNSQQCLRVKVRAVVPGASSRQIDKLHFNCLRIPSDIISTMHVHMHQRTKKMKGCVPEQRATFNDFNIGCTFARTQVMLGGNCLHLRLLRLSSDIDLYRSIINIDGPDNWRHTVDLRSTYYDKAERFILLPVNGQGEYTVKVELVCNTNGEIGRQSFVLKKMVFDSCLHVTSDPSAAVLTTSPTKPQKSHRNLAIVLVTLAVAVGIIIGTAITGYLIYTKQRQRSERTSRSQRRFDGTDEPLANG